MGNVYVLVRGGLGNQLFQAALGIAIEKATGRSVRYSSNSFVNDPYNRKYSLGCFPGFEGKEEKNFGSLVGTPLLNENNVSSFAEIVRYVESYNDIILDGYWQNEEYFSTAKQEIKKFFSTKVDDGIEAVANHLRSVDHIAVHVRRHDYGHHGLARMDYYRDSVKKIRGGYGNLPIVCFTDEFNFCAYEFRDIGNIQISRGDTGNPMADFYLMSCCRHFVLANSSFSWWAAWLNEEARSVIYAPQPWCVFDARINPAPARWRTVEGAVQGP